MRPDTANKLKEHAVDLEIIYKQRRRWLYASSIVYSSVIILIVGWDYLDSVHNNHIWWAVISLSMLISVNWWYWTMKSLSTLVRSVYSEYEILNEVTEDIEYVKILLTCKATGIDICKKCPEVDNCLSNRK